MTDSAIALDRRPAAKIGAGFLATPDDAARIDAFARWWAAVTPDQPALVERGGVWTYAQLGAAIERARAGLAESGVGRGDRVMIVGENCRALVAAMLAVIALDAWPAVVNARLSDREIDEIRDHCRPRRILYTTAVSPRGRAHAGRHGAVAWDNILPGQLALGPANPLATAEPDAADERATVAALVYTSGTTGRSKGVMLTHGNLLFTARTTGRLRALSADDTVYAVLPASHVLGLTGIIYGTLCYGGTLHLAPRFDPSAFLAAVQHDPVSVVVGAPAMFALVADYARSKGMATVAAPALRLISSAGAPLDPDLKRNIEQIFGLPLHNGFGVSECSPTVTQTRLDDVRSDTTVGRVLPGVQTRLVDAGDHDVPAGQVGELLVRGPNVMKGYYNEPDKTASVLSPDGWLRTGDLARFDGDYLYIVGRAKEMIVRFGYKVYPPEIEAVLNAHPAVVLCAVIGRPAEVDDQIIAFVQLVPGRQVTTRELMSYAAQRLATYKHPDEIVFVPELPTSAPGKIRKSELAALMPARAA